jgi:hypothetical protein
MPVHALSVSGANAMVPGDNRNAGRFLPGIGGASMPGAASGAGAWRRTKQWGWLAALAAGVLIAVFAVPRSQPKAQTKADDAPLLMADTALGEAMRGGDRAAARRLLSLQFSFIDAAGKTYQRRDVLADLKGTAAAPASQVQVHNYGLLATISGHRKSAAGSDVFFLDIWVRQKRAWRALVMQDVMLAAADAPPAAAPASAAPTKPYECKNPCQAVPYRVRSPAEQDVVNAFQAIVKAIVAHDAPEWGKHVADEFALYASGRAPVRKADRLAAIERQKDAGAVVTVGEVKDMRVAVYGDGAVMTTSEAAPEAARPPYRATRIFVRRNGQWLMAISAHTEAE